MNARQHPPVYSAVWFVLSASKSIDFIVIFRFGDDKLPQAIHCSKHFTIISKMETQTAKIQPAIGDFLTGKLYKVV